MKKYSYLLTLLRLGYFLILTLAVSYAVNHALPISNTISLLMAIYAAVSLLYMVLLLSYLNLHKHERQNPDGKLSTLNGGHYEK